MKVTNIDRVTSVDSEAWGKLTNTLNINKKKLIPQFKAMSETYEIRKFDDKLCIRQPKGLMILFDEVKLKFGTGVGFDGMYYYISLMPYSKGECIGYIPLCVIEHGFFVKPPIMDIDFSLSELTGTFEDEDSFIKAFGLDETEKLKAHILEQFRSNRASCWD